MTDATMLIREHHLGVMISTLKTMSVINVTPLRQLTFTIQASPAVPMELTSMGVHVKISLT